MRRNAGTGLIRTMGGWSQVLTLRKRKEKILCDERILGRDEFVERLLREADKDTAGQISINERIIEAEKIIRAACEEGGVYVDALKGGSRRGTLPSLRVQPATKLIENSDLTMAETARRLGVTTSAISRILERNK